MSQVNVDGVGIEYQVTGHGRPVVGLLAARAGRGRAGDPRRPGGRQGTYVGHDWGAALGWVLASFAPDKIDHLVALPVGNPVTFLRTFEQRQMSWYMLLFQSPASQSGG